MENNNIVVGKFVGNEKFKEYSLPMDENGLFEWEREDYSPTFYFMPDHPFKAEAELRIKDDKNCMDQLTNILYEFKELAKELYENSYPVRIQMVLRDRINVLIEHRDALYLSKAFVL
jgi:hypothetical protein